MDLKDKVKELPRKPGVYIMRDSLDNIIYIGKSKSLKNRVSQYFQDINRHAPKIQRMIKNIHDFEYIITDTEIDALLLECRLIKEYKPMYNSLLKNDRNYNYIRIDISEEFPDISAVQGTFDDEALYFGPFTRQRNVEEGIKFIKKYFKLRQCPAAKGSENNYSCLNFSLGNCTGPCTGNISTEEYNKKIKDIINLFEGKNKNILKDIEKLMFDYSDSLNFSEAAYYRDSLRVLNSLIHRQSIINVSKKKRNIIAVEGLDNERLKYYLFRGNKILFTQIMNTASKNTEELCGALYDQVLKQYANISGETSELISHSDIDEAQILYSYLKSNDKIRYVSISSGSIKNNNIKLYEKIRKFTEDFMKASNNNI